MKNLFAGTQSSDDIKEVYLESIEGQDEVNEFTLGKNTSSILLSDPKLLGFMAARHKFVTKMFDGFDKVLEIGCQEGFGSLLVAPSVRHLHAIDFYKPYIDSSQVRFSDRGINITFEAADVLNHIPGEDYQGIFALDVLEHIEKSEEDKFMTNIVNALSEHGTCIIGMPSLESQQYASKASKIGHVNCKTGSDLKAFCLKYFHNVYSFSMNDEVLHTGYFPMSHYLFVLCSSKR
ncbi:class I SAM-dependent methyltransferase [Pseudoalteromonas citrea]|uniref:Class I SAM-dependent methyltransferase n=1 Tax=Pseudoalteromonas citrea TaxID=43655 RepID=A0A5S3XTU5_9GAMM|nr:class I SAM-dependent methyltransferase [Pseudoalteromonas citrea]TMP43488.1 class I SAM-dependent methyltransferase [Pseudoalteromonas citrea]TMP62113.1 class I SAM-dependent methyltransferase [Pseudoalteromonas citrea]